MITESPMKQAGIRFSIVIPAFCEERLIGSLLHQFTPSLKERFALEIIVSDGGSTDATVRIAGPLADIVVENPDGHTQTIGEGRNRGADAAHGTVIIFLNADVTLRDPVCFFEGIAAAFVDPRVIAATCPVRVDPAEETRFDRIFHTVFNAYCRMLNFIGIGMGRGEVQAVRCNHFHEAGGYDEKLPAAEDFDLFRRLRRRGSVLFLAAILVYESPRRYRALGYPRVVMDWSVNALSVMLRGRSRSREWTPVR